MSKGIKSFTERFAEGDNGYVVAEENPTESKPVLRKTTNGTVALTVWESKQEAVEYLKQNLGQVKGLEVIGLTKEELTKLGDSLPPFMQGSLEVEYLESVSN